MRTPMIRRAGPYVVKSLANGNMRVEPTWADVPRAEGMGPGVFSRLSLAEEIEALLNQRATKRVRKPATVSGGA